MARLSADAVSQQSRKQELIAFFRGLLP